MKGSSVFFLQMILFGLALEFVTILLMYAASTSPRFTLYKDWRTDARSLRIETHHWIYWIRSSRWVSCLGYYNKLIFVGKER